MKNCILLISAILPGLTSLAQYQELSYDWHQYFKNSNLSGVYSDNVQVFNDTVYVGSQYYAANAGETWDADPGSGTDLFVAELGDCSYYFISRFTTAGDYIDSRRLFYASNIWYIDLIVGGDNRIIASTRLTANNTDFNPDGSPVPPYSAGASNITVIGIYELDGQYIGHIEYPQNAANYVDIRDLTLSPDNELFLTGAFSGTVDFDFTSGDDTHTSSGGLDAFIQKIDLTNASYIWTKTMGDYGFEQFDYIDFNENRIVVAGSFDSPTFDVDPGTGTYNLTLTGNESIAIAQYDLDGNFVNAILNSNNAHYSNHGGLCYDPQGNVYWYAGFYANDIIDADPGAATSLVNTTGEPGLFVVKYSGNLEYEWHRSFSDTGNEIEMYWSYQKQTITCENHVAIIVYEISGNLSTSTGGLYTTTSVNSSGNGTAIISLNKTDGSINDAALIEPKDNMQTVEPNHLAMNVDGTTYFTGFAEGIIDFVDDNTTLYDTLNQGFILKFNWTGYASFASEDQKISSVIYPNPASEELNIQSDTKISQIRIYDLNGRTIKTHVLNLSSVNLPVADLETGLYLLEITTEDGQKITQRFQKL